METKKQFLRILGIGLMLSAIVPVQAVDNKQSRWHLYRKCIARQCNEAEKAQVRTDAKRAGKWASALLIAAAIAVGIRYTQRQLAQSQRERREETAAPPHPITIAREPVGPEVEIVGIRIQSLNDVKRALRKIKRLLGDIYWAFSFKDVENDQSQELDQMKQVHREFLSTVDEVAEKANWANEDQLQEFKKSLQILETQLAVLANQVF